MTEHSCLTVPIIMGKGKEKGCPGRNKNMIVVL